ncbi:MAG: prepilin-type N-terminal cleavage/methylation domain-containing protein [Smithella sp.]|jgi:type II secretory pathway pseudopilin PulG
MKKNNRFTLIELLVVISIIIILVGILLPAINGVREKARVMKAKGEMQALAMAIKAYQGDYGVWPCKSATFDPFVAGDDLTDISKYRQMFERLSCADGPDSGTGIEENRRKIRYLDIPSTYGDNDDAYPGTTTSATKGDFKDPWGNVYQIFIDTTYDGKVTQSEEYLSDNYIDSDNSKNFLNGEVFIYSYGPDKSSTTKDDVKSWK